MAPEPVDIGVIGGSGLYEMEGLTDIEEIEVDTPFGAPSDTVVVGTLEGTRVAFLPRHGRGHRIAPADLPSRANIYALKSLGCRWVIGVCACGSLQEQYEPGHVVIPSGLFDRTWGRPSTFFGEGIVSHVSVADPYCPVLADALYDAAAATDSNVHKGGDLIIINGPRFSTRAESNIYRRWGLDIIGMTAAPEAFLAREAELAYAVMAHVTDYDVWHESEEAVTVEMVVRIVQENVAHAKAAIRNVIPMLRGKESEAWNALAGTIMTAPDRFPGETRERLGLLIDRYVTQ